MTFLLFSHCHFSRIKHEIDQTDLPREIDASHNGVYFTGARSTKQTIYYP